MDTISHAVAGYLMAEAINAPLEIKILSAFIGALPDIIGEAEKHFKQDATVWNWYDKAHYNWWVLWIFPPYGFHVILDSFTHTEGKRWWKPKERLWMEVVFWIILLFLFKLFYL